MSSCEYVFYKGANKDKRCPVKPRGDSKYCYKHQNTDQKTLGAKSQDEVLEIKKNEQTEILNSDKLVGGGRPVKEKSSVYYITINSNKVLSKMSDDDKINFKKFISDVFDGNNFLNFLEDRNSRPFDKIIKDIKIDKHFEVSAAGQLHCHAIVRIIHTGFLKLKANAIRALGKQLMGHSIHLDSPVSSDPVHSWEQYISKRNPIEF